MSELQDGGFVDFAAARSTMRKIRLRTSLALVEASAARLQEVLDHGFDPDCDVGAPLIESSVGLAQRQFERAIGGGSIDLIESQNVREQQLLEGMDLVLQLLDAVGVGFRHRLFSVDGQAEPIQQLEAGHRLSGGAK